MLCSMMAGLPSLTPDLITFRSSSDLYKSRNVLDAKDDHKYIVLGICHVTLAGLK